MVTYELIYDLYVSSYTVHKILYIYDMVSHWLNMNLFISMVAVTLQCVL